MMRRRRSVISRRVCPAISTSALGRSLVSGRNRVPRPAARTIAFISRPFSLGLLGFHSFQLAMLHDHFDAGASPQALRDLLREIDGAMLAAGASERNHQMLEAALLVGADAAIHERHHTGEKLMHALLLLEIFDDRRVFAGERFEAIFSARIRKAASIEDKSAAIAAVVFGQAAMEREAENSYDQIVGVGRQALQFFRRKHAVERFEQRRQSDGQRYVVLQPAQVLERIGDALQEVNFAFVESAEAVGAQRLHDADVNVGVVVMHEGFALEIEEAAQRIEIVVEQLLAQFRRQVGLGVVEKRGDVVLQRAFASALVVDEIGLAVAQHDVARLKVAIEEKIARSAEQKMG